MEQVLMINGLHKTIEKKAILTNLDLCVNTHDICALLGQNGAGKSTLIHIIATLTNFDQGEVWVCGAKRCMQDGMIRKQLGIVFQNSVLDERLSILDNLRIRSMLHEVHKTKQEIIDLLEVCHLKAQMHQRVATLSGGERRKADIARALLSDPKLLILDEPTTGLDPQARKQIWTLIKELKASNDLSILFTTHYIDEVSCANQVSILKDGMIKWQNSPEKLIQQGTKSKLYLVPYDHVSLCHKLDIQHIAYTCLANRIIIDMESQFQALSLLVMLKQYVRDFEVRQSSLEEAYLSLLGGEVACQCAI